MSDFDTVPDLQAAARAREQRIRPGDRVGLFIDGIEQVGIIEGPSPVWWRARLPDGRSYDFDIHNDTDWIEHQTESEPATILGAG